MKKQKITHLGSFFPSNVISQKKTEFQNRAAKKTNLLTHGFISNSAYPNKVATCLDFRALIDCLVGDGQALKGCFKHVGQQGHVTTEEDEFDDVIGKIADLIDKIRN